MTKKKKTNKSIVMKGKYSGNVAKKRHLDLIEANKAKKRKLELEEKKKDALKPAMEFPFRLDPFQNKAIGFVENGISVMVSAHTGKTVVALYAIALSLKNNQGVVYISPINALCKRKYIEFKQEFPDVGLLTGDVTIDPNASCLVMTTEIWLRMQYKRSVELRQFAWIIFDEVHCIGDREMGPILEESIIIAPNISRFVFLAPAVSNANEFADWVAKLLSQPCQVAHTDDRPVPLQHFICPIGGDLHLVVNNQGEFQEEVFLNGALVPTSYDKENKCQENLVVSVEEVLRSVPASDDKENKFQEGFVVGETSEESDTIKMVKKIITTKPDCFPVVCFSFSERECLSFATEMAEMDLSEDFREKEFTETIFRSGTSMLKDDKEFLQAATMLPLLKRGICVLHSGLLPILKDVIEVLFQKRLIKCLFATETFSIELNMQAKTVVFTNVRKVDGDKLRWITSREYMQISGRAGRRGIDDCGICILMVDEALELSTAKSMINGSADSLTSAFRLSYHMLLNQIQFEDSDPGNLIRKSFHQFQSDRADTTDHEVKSSPSSRSTREIDESNSILEKHEIADSSVWALKEEFDARLSVLKKLKYTTPTGSVDLKGQFASQISRADELTLTELMFRIKGVKVETIMCVLSCFVWENHPELDTKKCSSKKFARYFKIVQKVARKVAKLKREVQEDFVASLRPEAMHVIYALAKGSTVDALDMTLACEGPFIRGITRLGQLLEQLKEAATFTNEVELQDKLEMALNVTMRVLNEKERATFWRKKFTRYSNGVTVEVLKMGSGATASGGKMIRVFYNAWLKDGDKNSIESSTLAFRLGTHEVIRGLEFGVNLMRVGERRRLTIPPKWARGSGLAPLVPESAFLIVEVELLEVFSW